MQILDVDPFDYDEDGHKRSYSPYRSYPPFPSGMSVEDVFQAMYEIDHGIAFKKSQ